MWMWLPSPASPPRVLGVLELHQKTRAARRRAELGSATFRLGHEIIGRTDDESVAGELLERAGEGLVGGDGAILAPGAVHLVLASQERRRLLPRLRARRGDPRLAQDRQLG